MQDYWKQLRWTAIEPGWRAKTDTYMLFVPDAIYQHHLKRYFERIGLTLKTRSEVTQLAEDEWKRQCEAEEIFQANLDYWFTIDDADIEIYTR